MNTSVLIPPQTGGNGANGHSESVRGLAARTVVVILAAGKGTRMGRNDLAKVCFEIDGVPAINRVVTAFKKARFHKFLVVVNSHSEQVMSAVAAEHPEAMFAFQPALCGTGHAAQVAARTLEQIGHDGPVVVTAGDKYIEEEAIRALVDGHIRQRADFTLLALPKKSGVEDSRGRIILDEGGSVCGIVEHTAVAKQAILDELKEWLAKGREFSGSEVADLMERHVPNRKKQADILGELVALSRQNGDLERERIEAFVNDPENNLRFDGGFASARRIEERCRFVNPSLYLLEADAFYAGVKLLDDRNEQREYYVTDLVRHLPRLGDAAGRKRFRVRTVEVERGEWIQGFNSPDELFRIQEYVQSNRSNGAGTAIPRRVGLPGSQYTSARDWLERLERRPPSLGKWLTRIYGDVPGLHREKIRELKSVLDAFGRRFGFDRKAVIVRAPGRINLMGRHVDHRGGHNNFLALDRETFMVAAGRDDSSVVAISAQSDCFGEIAFNMSELLGRFAWSEWINFVDSDWVRDHLLGHSGDWGNYLKAAVLRLQHHYQDIRIQGMDLAVTGSIPMAAGLSSSSSLVVGASQAAIALNNLELTSSQFIDLCGQGEWFVGSRGGAGDHAAIYLGQRNKVVHVGNLPFREEAAADAPEGYRVVIANSHVKASKSSNARDLFNSRIACYNLGLALLKQRSPEMASRFEHVRDIDPGRLGVKPSEIYRLLLKVPETMTKRELTEALGERHAELLKKNFANHCEQESYPVRGVLLFGIAECARARSCLRLLQCGRVEEFGRLMNVSHDGDRVIDGLPDGTFRAHPSGCADPDLYRLLGDLASEEPGRVAAAQLINQPGHYACSTAEIDCMADTVNRIEGVAGSQIAGAGLGGCLMVLAHRDSVPAVRRELEEKYYRPRGLEPAVLECSAVEGAGLAEFS